MLYFCTSLNLQWLHFKSEFCPWPWRGIEWVKTRARVCEWLPFVKKVAFSMCVCVLYFWTSLQWLHLESELCPWPWGGIEWVKTRARVCEWSPLAGPNMFGPTAKLLALAKQNPHCLVTTFSCFTSGRQFSCTGHLFSRVSFQLSHWSQGGGGQTETYTYSFSF